MIRSRRNTFGLLVGIPVGMALAGLALPWIAGDQMGDQSAAPASTLEAGAPAAVESSTTTTLAGAVQTAASVPPGATAAPSVAPVGASSAPGAAAPGAPAAAATGPFEVGLTATTVKVGFLLLDVGNVGKVGIGVPGVDPKQQQQAIQIIVDDVNRRGGINGRKIVPAYRAFDVLSEDDMRTACLSMTEDQKVFAVVAAGGYKPAQGLCVTEEHKTPLIALCCAANEYFRRSHGLMFTVYWGGNRMMASWVAEMDRHQFLQGKKIGILADENYDPGQYMVKEALLPALQRYGYKSAHTTVLSGDLSTAASQVPGEVQQMRIAGVDTILLMSNTVNGTQFVQNADAQGYHPRYFTSDWAGMNTDATNSNMPKSYDGTLGWTVGRSNEWRVGMPEPPAGAACRKRFEAGAHRQVHWNDGTADYGMIVSWCDELEVLLAGLRGAGANLTRAGWSTAVQRSGTLPMGLIGGGTFRPGRFDLADQVRMQQYHDDCKCYRPAEAFHPSAF